MIAESITTKPSREYTDEELYEIESRGSQERLAELKPFAEHYPLAVVQQLYDNLLKHVLEQLPEPQQTQISNDLFVLHRYTEMYPGGKFDLDGALLLVDWCGAPEMAEAVGHVLTIMAEDGRLDQWT